MCKRKKETDEPEYEGYSSYKNYGNGSYSSYEDDDIKKKKNYLVPTLVILGLALIAGLFAFGVFRKKPARIAGDGSATLVVASTGGSVTLVATPTDDIVASNPEVSTGLSRAVYDSSGQRIGFTDLQGGTVSDAQPFIPLAIPSSLSSDSLQVLDQIAYPEGAVFDPQSGQLVVFGKPAKPGAKPSSSDFIVALRSVFDEQGPGVSIDPGASETVQSVRYIGPTEGTHAGLVMFEADRLMKNLSIGEDNITGQVITSSIPGHGTLFDFEFTLGDQTAGEQRRRFWFVVSDVEIEQSEDGTGMVITNLELKVKTEYLDSNWQTLSAQPTDPAGQAFAQQLTSHFDEYAQEYPVLDDLKALAYWTALAQWVKQADLPIQPELWIVQVPEKVETASSTPAITVTQQETQGNVIRTLSLWGGVDLNIEPKIKQASASTTGTLQQVLNWFLPPFTSHQAKVVAGISNNELFKGYATEVQLFNDLYLQYQIGGTGDESFGEGWTLELPRLQVVQGVNASQPLAYVYLDPVSETYGILIYAGNDDQTGFPVYVYIDNNGPSLGDQSDYHDSLRLEVQSDSLYLLKGNFVNGTSFEYDPDQFTIFNLDGQILTRSMSANETTEYLRQGKQLVAIESPRGRINFHYNKNKQIESIDQNDNQVKFIYDGSLLAEIRDTQNQIVERFEYGAQGQLLSRYDSTGQAVQTVRYDSLNRVSAIWQRIQGIPSLVLYDWQADGSLQVYSGEALNPWWEASDQNLEDLKTILRLQKKYPEFKQFLFSRVVGNRVLVLFTDRTYSLPKSLTRNPNRLRAALNGISAQAAGSKYVLISPGEVVGVGFQNLFPDAIPLYAEQLDEAQIVRNRAVWITPRGMSPQTGKIVNGLPLPAELDATGLKGVDPNSWIEKRDRLGALITGANFTPIPGRKIDLRTALITSPSVLVVVAHSDGTKVYLPDGTQLSIDDITKEDEMKLAELKPFVIFLSCYTASVDAEPYSFAKKLLNKGPSLVIAPSGGLPVDLANALVKRFLNDPLRDSNLLDAFFNSVHDVFPNGLIPGTDDGFDRFFKFIIGGQIPILQEV